MRCLPLLFFFGNDMSKNWELVQQSSNVTHGHERSHVAIWVYLRACAQVLDGMEKDDFLKELIAITEKDSITLGWSKKETKLVLELLRDIPKMTEEEIKNKGYVHFTLKNALWCYLRTSSYKSCLLKAVNLGEDADTIACVAGGLAALAYEESSIPKGWVRALALLDDIKALAVKVFEHSTLPKQND
jgi:ADP-ribosylglycohydrolase